jgi:hypothetical protein
VNLPSASRPVIHGPEVPLPLPQPTEILKDASTISCDSGGVIQSPQLFTQSQQNDVITDLGLPKEKAELLGSRLKENNLLAVGRSMYWHKSREQKFPSQFSQDGA